MLASKKGFTLIEILIVVAIIGILASVILVGLGPVQKKGRDARRLSDLRQIQNGLELYFTKNGAYPSGDFAAASAALSGGGIGITSVPNDPAPGKTYYYATDGTTYVLGATLEDTTNNVLNDDVDGSPIAGMTFSCDDPMYCIQL